MYTFHVTIHACQTPRSRDATIVLAGRTVATLDVPRQRFRFRSASVSRKRPSGSVDCREAASSRMDRFSRVQQGEPPWQVDGNLFDRNGRLLFVDLKGDCPAEEFDRLLAAIGWPETRLAFQLVREAVLLEEAEFRRWCASA